MEPECLESEQDTRSPGTRLDSLRREVKGRLLGPHRGEGAVTQTQAQPRTSHQAGFEKPPSHPTCDLGSTFPSSRVQVGLRRALRKAELARGARVAGVGGFLSAPSPLPAHLIGFKGLLSAGRACRLGILMQRLSPSRTMCSGRPSCAKPGWKTVLM